MMTLMFSSIITNFLLKKANPVLREKIKKTAKSRQFILPNFRINKMVINNFDIKARIIKLFFADYLINSIGLIIVILINLFANLNFLLIFINYSNHPVNFDWNLFLLPHLLFFLFATGMISDSYKLSLRDSHRNQYLKLIWFDLFTFNFLSFLGILNYKKTKPKNQFLKIANPLQITNQMINSQEIKEFFKRILRFDLFNFLINFSILFLAILIGYFSTDSSLHFLSAFFIFWTMFFIYTCAFQRLIQAIIAKKMFNKLLKNEDYFYLLSILRFLISAFGGYYVATLLHLLKVDDQFREYIFLNF